MGSPLMLPFVTRLQIVAGTHILLGCARALPLSSLLSLSLSFSLLSSLSLSLPPLSSPSPPPPSLLPPFPLSLYLFAFTSLSVISGRNPFPYFNPHVSILFVLRSPSREGGREGEKRGGREEGTGERERDIWGKGKRHKGMGKRPNGKT